MTHPLTPREKVELKPCPFCGRRAAMQFSKFELHDGFHVVCEGDKNCPLYCSTPYRAHDTQKEAAEVWNRRTALASGSGDHAELAMMANAALEIYSDDVLVVGGTRRIHADNIILYVKNGVDALLAENAALRAQHEADMDEMARAGQNLQSQRLAITEAERKLAEAVGLLEPFAKLADEEGGYREDDRLAWGLNTADINWGDLRAARTFLSKEAEQ